MRTAARRRQPFLMHKMAFHRARILSIIECTTNNSSSESVSNEVKFVKNQTLITLSDSLAPPLKPSRAEVFLPYALPGEFHRVSYLSSVFGCIKDFVLLPCLAYPLRMSFLHTRFYRQIIVEVYRNASKANAACMWQQIWWQKNSKQCVWQC